MNARFASRDASVSVESGSTPCLIPGVVERLTGSDCVKLGPPGAHKVPCSSERENPFPLMGSALCQGAQLGNGGRAGF